MKDWIKKWVNKNRLVILICIGVVGLCTVPFIWNECFFVKGENNKVESTTFAETLKYIGAFLGGILLIINAYFVYRRMNEQAKSNNLTAKGQNLIVKGQLDTRFKDAAMLLAQENTSANLSGIYALHQIAVEASQTEDQKDYVKVIKDILIAFIKDNSVFEYKKDENGEILLDDIFREPIIEKGENKKSKIVLQTIIDKLFRDNNCGIYIIYDEKGNEISTILSKTALKGINFNGAQLDNVRFSMAQLDNASFIETKLYKTFFMDAQLQNTFFNGVQLQGVFFRNAELQNASFEKAELQKANFRGAQLQSTRFSNAQLQDVDFLNAYDIDKAIFHNTSWNEKTNFKGTAFENKTIEELTKIMGLPPEPLDSTMELMLKNINNE